MTELSREQVEALVPVHDDEVGDGWVRVEAVAAMLTEARAEAVRKARPLLFDAGWDACLAYQGSSAAAGAPPEPREGESGTPGREDDE